MPLSKKILLVGSSAMELVVNVARLPDAGECVKDEGGVTYAPGGGSTAAVAFARLAAETVFVTRLGADVYGQKLYSYYKASGIDTSFVKVDRDFATGCSMRINEADGKSRTIEFVGAGEHVGADLVSEALSSAPDAMFLSFELSFDMARRAARIAEARRVPIMISASPASANHPLEALPAAELFVLSAADAFRYTGIRLGSSQETLRAAFALGKKVKARYVVINQGARGVVVYDGKRCEMIGALSGDNKPVDPTASEEAFAAALCTEYLRCADIKAAARYASAAGAIAASRHGAAPSVPTDAEVRALVASSRF